MKPRAVLVAATALLALWEVVARLWGDPLLPPAVIVLQRFAHELPRELGLHAAASLGRVLGGITLAVITAVPAGLLLGQHPRANRIFGPVLYLQTS